jgi:diacylglycerol kinase family enzyme
MNQGAGASTGNRSEEIRETIANSLQKHGIDATLRAVAGEQLAEAAKAAAKENYDAVIAGGGDGTISTVAGALIGSQNPLGVLPLGTLNHFAKDLGIPLTIPEAIAVIAAGNQQQLDVAQVNDRIFINNSSLGIYPRAVLDREQQQSRFGWSKWPAMAIALLRGMRRFPLVEVRLDTGSESVIRHTPLVFVGNNLYEIDLLNIGKRKCLDQGELSLYLANVQSRWGLFKLTLRAMVGRLRQSRDFESVCLEECWIESKRHHLHVSVDGEVIDLKPPLHYRSLKHALSVFVPKMAPSESQTTVAKRSLSQ